VTIRRILVINGHPDPSGEHFAAALTAAYLRGANGAGHQIRRIDAGALDLPPMRSLTQFMAEPSATARDAQAAIAWADHLVIVFPLWLGGMPAALKAFFEQVFRYGFALTLPGTPYRGLLKGRTARVVVSMGMPATVFRFVFDAAGVKSLTRGILRTSGFSRVRSSLVGTVEASPRAREDWLRRIERLGAEAR